MAQARADQVASAPRTITLVAVSKRQPLAKIAAAYACGVRDFGENYVQEAEAKIGGFAQASDCRWHLLGPLQANKTAVAARLFSWIHTLDRLKIARRLGQARLEHGLEAIAACVQVNLGGERTKAGLAPGEVAAFVAEAGALPGIALRGLMCIPEAGADELATRARFEELAALLAEVKRSRPQLDTLSMGMSADFPLAIAAGATMIRVGTTLFGPRPA